MKVIKGKRRSQIGTKRQVFSGMKRKTKWGMKQSDLMKNKSGKVVSKKKAAQGKLVFQTNLSKWVTACSKARRELGLVGFVPIKKGSAFYSKVKELLEKS